MKQYILPYCRFIYIFGCICIIGIIIFIKRDDQNILPAEQEEKIEKTHVLQSETFTQKASFTGVLKPKKETIASSKIQGRLEKIYIDISDNVFRGQLLAQLQNNESYVQLKAAGTKHEHIRSIIEAQEQYLEEQVEVAKKKLDEAQAFLQANHNQSNQEITSLYSVAEDAIRITLIAVTDIDNWADNILGVSINKKNINDEFESHLGSLDRESLTQSQSLLQKSLQEKINLEKIYQQIKEKNTTTKEEDINAWIKETLTIAEQHQDMLESMYKMLKNTTTSDVLNKEKLDIYKKELISHGNNLENIIFHQEGGNKKGLRGMMLAREDIEVGKVNTVDTAKKQVAVQKANLKSAEAIKVSEIKRLKKELSAAASHTSVAKIALGNTQIGSPISGKIIEKFIEEGEVVQVGQPLFRVADTSGWKIIMNIADHQLSYIKKGMKAKISFDALAGEYKAVIVKIIPHIDDISHTLQVELLIENNGNLKQAISGMFTNIEFEIEDKKSYFIPRNFLIYNNGPNILTEKGLVSVIVGQKRQDDIKIWWPEIKDNIILHRK
jgi:multidrug resistance efflux pump